MACCFKRTWDLEKYVWAIYSSVAECGVLCAQPPVAAAVVSD